MSPPPPRRLFGRGPGKSVPHPPASVSGGSGLFTGSGGEGGQGVLGGASSGRIPPGNVAGVRKPGGGSCFPHLLLPSPPPRWAVRYVKTTANATVDHLSKYLALRIALEEEAPGPGPEPPALDDVSEKQYTIYITTAGGAFTVREGRGWTGGGGQEELRGGSPR